MSTYPKTYRTINLPTLIQLVRKANIEKRNRIPTQKVIDEMGENTAIIIVTMLIDDGAWFRVQFRYGEQLEQTAWIDLTPTEWQTLPKITVNKE